MNVIDPTMIEGVRRFNRTVTQRVGALNDAYLARDRPLSQARLLWEIGRGPSGDVRALRTRLDLDSGYLSRLLRSLEADGLIVVEPSPTDGRVRVARLTEAGTAERALLDQRADDLAGGILATLSPGQRTRLVAAMAEVDRLLTSSMVEVEVIDPRDQRAQYCLAAYVAELGERFPAGFDPGQSISAREDELTRPAGLFVIATLHGDPVGCGGLKFHGPSQAAELKRMWVAHAVRGLGLGRRLLTDLEGRAAEHGVRVLRLETNGTLTEAVALYRGAGYREVPAFSAEPYAHHWFEKVLTRGPS